jgi:hypothetical protein
MTVPATPQLATHIPLPLQLAVAPIAVVVHLVPQLPQLLLSLFKFTHADPQIVFPAVLQVATHDAALQLAVAPVTPVVQTWPQVAQSLTSLCKLTHAPLHGVCPAVVQAQFPLVHTAVAGHLFPHAPQLL